MVDVIRRCNWKRALQHGDVALVLAPSLSAVGRLHGTGKLSLGLSGVYRILGNLVKVKNLLSRDAPSDALASSAAPFQPSVPSTPGGSTESAHF